MSHKLTAPTFRIAAAIFSLAVLIQSTGCMLFQLGGKGSLDDVVPEGTGNSYTVMIKGDKPTTREITEGMTIQKVLEESGALKRFNRMDVVVKRVVPGKPMRHRLAVDFDSSKKRVPYDQDYAIYPNDIVTIAPDGSTQIDRMVDSITGAIRGKR